VRNCLAGALFLVAALSLGSVAAAQTVLPPMFGDWSIAQTSAPPPNSVDQVDPTDAPALREYGFEALEYQRYARNNDSLEVILYRMTDPTAAFGAFTYLRSPEMRASNAAPLAAVQANRALLVVGNFLLDVRGARAGEPSADLKQLATSVAPKADRRPFPTIGQHLPDQGLVAGSERYFLGPLAVAHFTGLPANDWEGFNKGAEAILAKYRHGAQEASLLVFAYPTQQIAAQQFLQVQQIAAAASADQPGPRPLILAQRSADLVTLAFANRADKFASSLLHQVKYGHDVTWNEPAFKAKEPSINVYVIGAFAGTGAILMLTVISGLGFAVLRLLTKIFFPGRVFDRRESIEILQLGLTGHRTDTGDLYRARD
jgi:hypothetical protein